LVGQPEAYENPMFVEALNRVTDGRLTTAQAAEEFGVRESALVAAVSWSDTAPLASSTEENAATDSLKVTYQYLSVISA